MLDPIPRAVLFIFIPFTFNNTNSFFSTKSMFGFNKKKHRPNIRLKRDEDEDAKPSVQHPPQPNIKNKPKKSKSKKSDKSDHDHSKESMPKLSFDDEMKAEADFKVKKSSISRKLVREREREKSKQIKDVLVVDELKEDEEFIVMDDMDLDGEPDNSTHKSLPNPVSHVIPDAHAIHKARKKRELARMQQESEHSYIPVKDRNFNHDKVYKSNNSRLIREEDDSGDERIDMKVHTEEDNVDEIHIEDEKDEEFLQWEKEQMKKGSLINTGTELVSNNQAYTEKPKGTKLAANDYIPKYILPEISIDAISNEITGELNSLRSLTGESERDLESSERAMETCEQNISKYEQQVAGLSSAFQFYQETKCFINDYSKLLSLKIESIEQVENDIYSLFQKRCNDAREIRRSQQQRLSVQVGVIKGHSDNRYMQTYDVPNHCPHSDEEVEQEFVEKYNEIVDKSEAVMTDVRTEYSEITFVKQQFEKWKHQQGESYRNAYITQCLPLVFSPLIRLEMLGWNPIQPSCPNFEEYSWFLSLMTYGTTEGHDPSKNDPDTNLIPIIINKVLLPKVTKLIKCCWDPFSTQQTMRLVSFLKLLFEDYVIPNKKSPEMENLIKGIQHEIEQLIIHEAFLPFTADRSSNTDSKIERFLSFQYIKCIKILKNILLWEEVLPTDLVFKLSVDSLLNRHIVAFLQTSPNYLENVEKIDMVIKTLPVAWFEKSDKLLSQLNSFATYLASLVQTIERKQTQCANDADKKLHKTAMRRVMSMLLRINAMDLVRKAATNNS